MSHLRAFCRVVLKISPDEIPLQELLEAYEYYHHERAMDKAHTERMVRLMASCVIGGENAEKLDGLFVFINALRGAEAKEREQDEIAWRKMMKKISDAQQGDI